MTPQKFVEHIFGDSDSLYKQMKGFDVSLLKKQKINNPSREGSEERKSTLKHSVGDRLTSLMAKDPQ